MSSYTLQFLLPPKTFSIRFNSIKPRHHKCKVHTKPATDPIYFSYSPQIHFNNIKPRHHKCKVHTKRLIQPATDPIYFSYSPQIHFNNIISRASSGKVKVTLVQALRLCTGRTAQTGSRGIALLFHDQRH